MKISYNWLKEYVDGVLPAPQDLAQAITMKSFEIESIEEIGSDTVLDVKVLPNRNHDCLSHMGMAQEICAITGLTFKSDSIPAPLNFPLSKSLTVQIEDEKQCLRYIGAVVKNIKVGPSPAWLVEKLASMGQRSINNIVDATNYVMFAVGQPLHAFDMDKMEVRNGVWSILTRDADTGEKITALDGNEYDLPEKTLLICDGNSNDILGIAGIKGGRKAEIDVNTKNVILESANFNPVTTRLSAKAVGIRTDASVRFENGITPILAEKAMSMLVRVLMEIAGDGNTTVEGVVDVYPRPSLAYKTGITLEKVNSVLGTKLSKEEVFSCLQRVGVECEFLEPQKKVVAYAQSLVGVPYKFGASVLRDAPKFFDCSSFVSHVFAQAGFTLPRISVDQYVFTDRISVSEAASGDLIFANSGVGNIYFETNEYMRGTKVPAGVDHVGIYIGDGKIVHATAHENKGVIIEEIAKSTSFQHIVGYGRVPEINTRRIVCTIPPERLDLRRSEDLIEEVGRIYGYDKVSAIELPAWQNDAPINKRYYYSLIIRKVLLERGYSEVYTYVFAPKGDVEVLKPLASDKSFLRTNIKDGLQQSLEMNIRNADIVGISSAKLFEIGDVFTKEGEFEKCAIGVKNPNGYKGLKENEELTQTLSALDEQLHSSLVSTVKNTDTLIEFNLNSLLEKLPQPKAYEPWMLEMSAVVPKYKSISIYPFAVRDIAVFVPENVSSDEIEKLIREVAQDLLVRVSLFDVFTKSFPDGTKKTSYAFRLVLQSMVRTLSEMELTEMMNSITAKMNSHIGWQVR